MSLSKTLYPLLGAGSTLENPFQHDLDVKNQINKQKYKPNVIKSMILLVRMCLNYILCSVVESSSLSKLLLRFFAIGNWKMQRLRMIFYVEVIFFYNGKHRKTPNDQVTKKLPNNGYAKKTPKFQIADHCMA